TVTTSQQRRVNGIRGSAEVADGGVTNPERTQDPTQRGDEKGVLDPENARQRAADQDAERMHPSFQDMHTGIHAPEQVVRSDRLAQTDRLDAEELRGGIVEELPSQQQ